MSGMPWGLVGGAPMGSLRIPWDSYGWGPMGTPGIPWGSQGSHGDPRGVISMNLWFPKDLHSRNLLGNSHGRQEISLSLSLGSLGKRKSFYGLSGREERVEIIRDHILLIDKYK